MEEFLCETDSIRKHQPVEKQHVKDLHNAELKDLKAELNEESKESRPMKDGLLVLTASDCAALSKMMESEVVSALKSRIA